MLSLSLSLTHTHTHTHTYIYTCVAVEMWEIYSLTPSDCSGSTSSSLWMVPASPGSFLHGELLLYAQHLLCRQSAVCARQTLGATSRHSFPSESWTRNATSAILPRVGRYVLRYSNGLSVFAGESWTLCKQTNACFASQQILISSQYTFPTVLLNTRV